MENSNSLGTAVITGASSGLGEAYARRLAQRGFDVVLVARSEARLRTLAAEITVDTGRSAQVVVADLTNRDDLERVAALLRSDESISLLVNNAGLGKMLGFNQVQPDENVMMIDLNITALTQLTQAVLPKFIERQRGGLINVASALAIWPPFPIGAVYSASKAYVLSLTRTLALELEGQNIQVQAVLPGAVRTEFYEDAGFDLDTFPAEAIMSTDEAVDAALAGWDLGELITIPSLEDIGQWNAYDDQRASLVTGVSRSRAASRYSQFAAVGGEQ
ncbi:MAG: SDR family NAD(P)-dependent oxidoreductase [Thermomicrobiales bacterium]